MKVIPFVLLFAVLTSCGTNKLGSDSTLENDLGFKKNEFVAHFSKLQNDNLIGLKPLTIIDGEPYEYSGYLLDEVNYFTDLKVKKITHMKIEKAVGLFGKRGKEGVLMLNTY
ncbi:MAG: hypothetical protein AAF489_13260 [Bacteroidota bacterium]